MKTGYCPTCMAWREVPNRNVPMSEFECSDCEGSLMTPSYARRKGLVSQSDYDAHKGARSETWHDRRAFAEEE